MPSRNKIVIPTLAVSQKCGQEEDEDNDDDEEGSSPTLPKFEIVMLLNYFGDNRQLDHIVATDELAMSSCTTNHREREIASKQSLPQVNGPINLMSCRILIQKSRISYLLRLM